MKKFLRKKNKLKDNFWYCKWIVHIKNTGLSKFEWLMFHTVIKTSEQDLKLRGKNRAYVGCRVHNWSQLWKLITHTCRKGESCFIAQNTTPGLDIIKIPDRPFQFSWAASTCSMMQTSMHHFQRSVQRRNSWMYELSSVKADWRTRGVRALEEKPMFKC